MSVMIRLLCCVLGCLWLCAASASTVVLSRPVQDKLDLTPYIEYLFDPLNNLTISQVYGSDQFSLLAEHMQMRPLQAEWIRFTLQNATETPQSLIMDFDQALYNELRFYTIVRGVRQETITGQDYPFSSRALHYHYFGFPLVLAPGDTMEVYAHIDTAFQSLFTPFLIDQARFPFIVSSQALLTGGVIGVLGGIIVFLLFFMAMAENVRRTFWLLLLSCASLASVVYKHGYLQMQIPDLWTETRNILFPVICVLQSVALLQLIRTHYQTNILFQRIDGVLLVVTGMMVTLLPLAAFVPVHALLNLSFIMMSVMLFICLLCCGWMFMQNQRKYSVFTLGLLAFILMSSLVYISGYGWLPPVPLVRYGYEVGLTLQVVILSLAVVSRLFEFQREKMTIESEMLKLNADLASRSEFVAKVTHDIKGPLAAVLAAEELLRDEASDTLRTRYHNIIRASGKMVVKIVDDILDYARLQQGIVRTEQQPFDVRLIVSQIEQGIEMVNQGSPVVFRAVVSDAVPSMIVGDAMRLSQVLSNLLNNALKFTASGEVKLVVDVADTARVVDGNMRLPLRITVSDTGSGMSPEFVQRAFDAYTRDEAGGANGVAGFGLGLAICKQLIVAMGGTIVIQSEKGRGTCFVVLLPVGVPDVATS